MVLDFDLGFFSRFRMPTPTTRFGKLPQSTEEEDDMLDLAFGLTTTCVGGALLVNLLLDLIFLYS
jgi:hypothetical protein